MERGEVMNIYKMILCFFIYGFLGWCTEVAFAAVKERRFVNRGFLNGPICPIYGVGVVMVAQLLMPYQSNLLLLYITSVIVVTALEWLTGFALDKIFHNKWWDYSDMPFNLNGYVCLLFSLIWGVACVVIVKWIHPLIYKGVLFLPIWLVITLDVILVIAVFTDLFVTVSKILKVNQHLEKMEEIATELHRISNEIGQNISKDILGVIERRDDISGEMSEKITELRKKYSELAVRNAKNMKRLVKAFPRMTPRKHKEIIEELKNYLKKK